MKKILIAIPTAKNIEVETFKSIYDQIIPKGYHVDFQYFFGYTVTQVRNLIADWSIKNGYDYLFAVDADMQFAPDTLMKMLSHDVDMVTGVYRQRKPQQILELYRYSGPHMLNVDYNDIRGKGLVEVDGCGFGCILIKTKVFADVGYPQFEYHMGGVYNIALSEDNDFLIKAKKKGFKLWCDTSIVCGHIGSTTFTVQ